MRSKILFLLALAALASAPLSKDATAAQLDKLQSQKPPAVQIPLPDGLGMACVQQGLAALGFDVGAADGVAGGRTKAAASLFDKIDDEVLPALSDSTAEEWCAIVKEAVTLANSGGGADFQHEIMASWTGYKPIREVLMAPVRDIAVATVLMIKTVGLRDGVPVSYELVETASTERSRNPSDLAENYRTLQIETCRNQGLRKCPIFTRRTQATAFIGDGREVLTCRHAFHDWVVLAAEENNILPSQVSPPLWLRDVDGKTIYNSATTDHLLSIVRWNPDERLNHPESVANANLLNLSEFASLISPVNLVEPYRLPMASTFTLAEGDKLYAAGFPGPTSLFDDGGGDTDGKGMVASSGNFISVNRPQGVILSDNFATGGMSGGLVTNDSGGVVGVLCRTEFPTHLRAHSHIFDRTFHAGLWKQLLMHSFPFQ